MSLLYGEGPVKIHDIADRQNIPFKFLQQILASLKMTGFVESQKGPGGGYLLACTPKEITLGSIVRAMDGPIAPVSCVSVTHFDECGCPNPEICSLRQSFQAVRNAMSQVLDTTTFADLAERQLATVDSILCRGVDI